MYTKNQKKETMHIYFCRKIIHTWFQIFFTIYYLLEHSTYFIISFDKRLLNSFGSSIGIPISIQASS